MPKTETRNTEKRKLQQNSEWKQKTKLHSNNQNYNRFNCITIEYATELLNETEKEGNQRHQQKKNKASAKTKPKRRANEEQQPKTSKNSSWKNELIHLYVCSCP